MKGLKATSNIKEGVFLKNEKGSVLKIKEVFHEMVIFDEEGTEHVLPKDMFQGYLRQEDYKEVKVKRSQNLKEVVESKQSANSIIESLCEGSVSGKLESIRYGVCPCFSVDLKTFKVRTFTVGDDLAADSVSYPVFGRNEVSYCYESGHSESSVKGIANTVAKMLKGKKSYKEVEKFIEDQDR